MQAPAAPDPAAPDPAAPDPAAPETARRVLYFNAGFLRQRRLRRIMALAGYPLGLGRPGPDDLIAVWGQSPYARRGAALAARSGAQLLRVEDAFLRSLHPGRSGEPPLGLLIDRTGVHFDARSPSDLETLLATHPLDQTPLLDRAREAAARLPESNISKYNAFDPAAPCPDPGYVLVIDQTSGDASLTACGANANTFREMLTFAQQENPGARILIKTHPETLAGHRSGHFSSADETSRISLFSDPVSPWHLLSGATAVYTVSSQLGFEAIFAGHRPHVFGQPFYAGWDLTEDRHPAALSRRGRPLSRAQLFAGAMILYPTWYDPDRDRLCPLEDTLGALEARSRAWREDRHGWAAAGMRLWKRPALQGFFAAPGGGLRFCKTVPDATRLAAKTGRRAMAWASATAPDDDILRVEDGFLRSRGLGARLVPPLSLVCDDLGIYYDPTRESRLERLIAARANLRPGQDARAEALIRALCDAGLSKYNLGGALPALPDTGQRILVPGQVEDDASIRLGAGDPATNLGLLKHARAANPGALILFKPHPDVEAGLRPGAISPDALSGLADHVLTDCDPAALLSHVDAVWTMTSLLGFEALLRGLPVTTTGAPFYAGWGLTRDLGRIPARRGARPSLHGLAHAALIDYPRYRDPLTGQPCAVETIVARLAAPQALPSPGAANRMLSKLQGLLASQSWIWR